MAQHLNSVRFWERRSISRYCGESPLSALIDHVCIRPLAAIQKRNRCCIATIKSGPWHMVQHFVSTKCQLCWVVSDTKRCFRSLCDLHWKRLPRALHWADGPLDGM